MRKMKRNETVIVNRNGELLVGDVKDMYTFKKMRMYDVLLENGTLLQEVRQDRRNKFCASYIDTTHTNTFINGNKLENEE